MAYREINRSEPNDGLGDDARTWAGKTNENFKEVFSRGFTLSGFLVSRITYDATETSFDAFKENDMVRGWEDSTVKDRFIEGIVLVSGCVLPDDIDDATKFLITNETLNA